MFDPDPGLDALLQSLLHPGLKKIDPSLHRIEKLLAALGHPERTLPPVVHVAGTNGKGSTVAFLRAIIEAAGYRCHVYTSPHLVHFRERIVVAGKEISNEVLVPLLKRIQGLQDDYPATFFEATTAAAFVAFAETPADIVLLETGMGGRLDATNVIDHPALNIITAIGMDHAEYLGDTVKKIAGEKAAIMKPGSACILAKQAFDEARLRCEQEAEQKSINLLSAGREWQSMATSKGLLFSWQGREYDFPAPALPGAYQYDNAGNALAASMILEQQGFAITDQARALGLLRAKWPARLQNLTQTDWGRFLKPGQNLVLDGGHNVMAAEGLAEWIKQQPAPCALIVGMLKTKDAEGFFAALAPHVETVYTVPIPGEEEAVSAEALAALASRAGIPTIATETVEQALTLAAKQAQTLVICGSLYLAGWVLAQSH